MSNTADKILSDESYILDEIKRIQFFYGLKNEIRYGEKRSDENNPESVAEHVYAMHVLFDYFWPLENPELSWNQAKMRQMINFHDVDEVVTGDVIGYLKTNADKKREDKALNTVLESIPESMKDLVLDSINEYKEKHTTEARFIKAVDKIEPVFHVFNDEGKKLLHRMGTTKEQHDSIKIPYFKDFPVIKRFYEVSMNKMQKEGFFIN